MEIYNVPDKANLVYLDAQYFHNSKEDGSKQRGITQHVIKIQYRSKRGTMKNFIIPLSTVVKEVNRKARKKLHPDDAQVVVDITKALKEKGQAFGFGFRQVTVTERTDKGGRLFHKEQDTNVSAWVFFDEASMRVQLLWGKDVIEVTINPHKELKHDRQSMGIGYWNKNEELEQAIRGKNNDKRQDLGTQSSQVESSAGMGVTDEVAATDRQHQTERVGRSDQVSVAMCVSEHAGEDQRPVESPAPKPTRSRPDVVRKANSRKLVDQCEWGVWQPEDVPTGTLGLGTSLRIRANV